jgi:hypothetical protein
MTQFEGVGCWGYKDLESLDVTPPSQLRSNKSSLFVFCFVEGFKPSVKRPPSCLTSCPCTKSSNRLTNNLAPQFTLFFSLAISQLYPSALTGIQVRPLPNSLFSPPLIAYPTPVIFRLKICLLPLSASAGIKFV